jgi:hypothetical protein
MIKKALHMSIVDVIGDVADAVFVFPEELYNGHDWNPVFDYASKEPQKSQLIKAFASNVIYYDIVDIDFDELIAFLRDRIDPEKTFEANLDFSPIEVVE